MSDRYTKRHAEAAFLRLVDALGPAPAGQHWALDHAPGGYVVELVKDQGGGVSQPFGWQRRNAREFVTTVRFLTDALYVMKENAR